MDPNYNHLCICFLITCTCTTTSFFLSELYLCLVADLVDCVVGICQTLKKICYRLFSFRKKLKLQDTINNVLSFRIFKGTKSGRRFLNNGKIMTKKFILQGSNRNQRELVPLELNSVCLTTKRYSFVLN